MRYSEGPWWVPLVLMGGLFLAITTAPQRSGEVVRSVFDGLGTVLDAAIPDTPPNPLETPR